MRPVPLTKAQPALLTTMQPAFMAMRAGAAADSAHRVVLRW